MSLTIPDDLLRATHLSEDELLQELALTLFQQRRLSTGQAARLARLDRWSFQQLLGKREIPVHYDVKDLEADLETLRKLGQL